MKKLIYLLAALLPLTGVAQNFTRINQLPVRNNPVATDSIPASDAAGTTWRIPFDKFGTGGGGGGGNALTSEGLDQFAATTSLELKGVITDELGNASGKLIFALGTLNIATGKVFTANNTITLAGVDASTLNIGTGGTLAPVAFSGAFTDLNGIANIVQKTVANTYGAGLKQRFVPSATTAGLAVSGVTTDPSALTEGDVWYRTDLHRVRYHNGTSAFSVASTADASGAFSEMTVADANVTWTNGVTTLRQTAALTANRSATLPAANSYNAGSVILYVDQISSPLSAFGRAFTPAGSDIIQGGLDPYAPFIGNGNARLETNGTNAWTVLDSRSAILNLQDSVDPTKQAHFSITNVPSSTDREINIAGTANSTTIVPNAGTPGDCVTGVTADGVLAFDTCGGGGGGAGDVTGPAVSVDNQIALFSGTTGKIIKADTVAQTGTGGVVRSISPTITGSPTLALTSIQGLSITGSAGVGNIKMDRQATAPGGTANSIKLFADTASQFAWADAAGRVRTITGTITANRTYATPDESGTFALAENLGDLASLDSLAFSDLTGLLAWGQVDNSTTVTPEAATVNIAANTRIKTSATGTLTTIAFTGGANEAQRRQAEIDFDTSLTYPFTLTIPTCRRLGDETSRTNIVIPQAAIHEFSFIYVEGEYLLADSVASSSGGGGVDDTVYGVAWNGATTTAPSQNAVYDKLNSILTTGEPVIWVALSDETTSITTGTAKVTVRAPYAFTVTAVRANLNTVSSSGIPTVDINEGAGAGTTILSTKLTIDASEFTSTTAATPAVISDTAIADDAQITFDVDVSGTGAKGLKVVVYGYR